MAAQYRLIEKTGSSFATVPLRPVNRPLLLLNKIPSKMYGESFVNGTTR
jgi:hypothetical protein